MSFKDLSDEEKRVIVNKGTERPFSGIYNDFYDEGIFLCKRCGEELYNSTTKFSSGCGWPSFDEDLGTVKRVSDADGRRVEIVCSSCDAHLGHVFEGERFTPKNTRHCVNSISLDFKAKDSNCDCNAKSIAYFAAGCFWGVEYYFQKQEGVHCVVSGYMGGHVENPAYENICTGQTGHLEVVKVEYDECKISYINLCKLFFEIHNFTQKDGQGPDLGSQYLSAIFYVDEKQKDGALELIDQLTDKGYDVATSLYELVPFYPGEDYHQNYYKRHQKVPYCHSYKKIF